MYFKIRSCKNFFLHLFLSFENSAIFENNIFHVPLLSFIYFSVMRKARIMKIICRWRTPLYIQVTAVSQQQTRIQKETQINPPHLCHYIFRTRFIKIWYRFLHRRVYLLKHLRERNHESKMCMLISTILCNKTYRSIYICIFHAYTL